MVVSVDGLSDSVFSIDIFTALSVDVTATVKVKIKVKVKVKVEIISIY